MWAQVMSLGLLRNSNTLEFVRMKGPNGKGYAEMAIQKLDAVSKTESSTTISQVRYDSVLSVLDVVKNMRTAHPAYRKRRLFYKCQWQSALEMRLPVCNCYFVTDLKRLTLFHGWF